MKKLLTRAEVEAIGQNWSDRRDELFNYARNKENPYNKRMKAIGLAAVLIMRLSRIIEELQQSKTRKEFLTGGAFSSIPPREPEYIVRTDFSLCKTYPNLAKLEDECAKACKVWPDWTKDFKAIRQKYYTESQASVGSTLLESARKLLLSLDVDKARRYIDIALA